MPHEIHGLPVHPLAVHGAVVLVPLAALLAILFVVPRTRRWAALPMALVSVAGFVAVYVAKVTGHNLENTLIKLGGGQAWLDSPIGKAVGVHAGRASTLVRMMLVFAVIAVVVYLLWLAPSWIADRVKFTGVVEYVACAVLIVGAAAVGIQCYRVGESGSKAVWNPDGTTDYSSSSVLVGQLNP